MFSNKMRTVLKALGGSRTDESGEPPPKITVIFMVALAIRKFQKFESRKYKKQLSYDFDKKAALKELKSLAAADKYFYLQHFVKMAYFIRKFHLTIQDFGTINGGPIVPQIMEHLRNNLDCNQTSDQRRLYFLCNALKFLTQNSDNNSVSLQDMHMILDICRGCKSPFIVSQLVSMLMHWFQKQDPSKASQDSQLLLFVLDLPNLESDAKAFFLSKLESNKLDDQTSPGSETSKSMAVPKVKKNQQVVSKTIQTVRSKQETKSSEELDFQFLNLTDCMKSRNRKMNCQTVATEDFENINKEGDDRSMLRNTWQEVINLYSLVSRGEVLKVDDKDNYLPTKLFGNHYFMGAAKKSGLIYSFFINRMCALMFQKLSRRQQLNSKAVDKLMKCITDFQSMLSLLKFQEDLVGLFVEVVFNEYWAIKKVKEPDMAFNLLKEIMDQSTEEYVERGWIYNSTEVRRTAYDQDSIRRAIVAEINSLRVDAVRAIYSSAVRNKKEILTKERLTKIALYLKHQGKDTCVPPAFLDHVIKLNELAETLDDFDYKATFQIYLSHLESSKSLEKGFLEAVLRFMKNQARDMKRGQELFSDNVLARMIRCLIAENSSLGDQHKCEIMETINTYLEHEATAPLNSTNLQNLLSLCLDHGQGAVLIKPCLTALLLSTNRTQALSQNVLKSLQSIFHQLVHSEECTSFVVFIISRVFCARGQQGSRNPYLADPDFVESISNKLFSDHVVQLDSDNGERVIFKAQSEDDVGVTTANQIAFLTAKIIWRSVENRAILSPVTIDNLILILTNSKADEKDKQLKIMAAKCLHGLTKYMQFTGDHLNQLLELINSPIYDVSIYVQAAYVKGCAKVAFASLPAQLDAIHLENISALYVTESLRLGQDDYQEEINQGIFKTLLYEARKQEFGDTNLFLLFDNILNLNGKYAPQVLAILVTYSYQFAVPEATVRTLENLLTVSNYFDKALLILKNVIQDGRLPVSKKTLNVFTENLQSSVDSRMRLYSFKLLEQASRNQELPDEVFYQSELARAGFALESTSRAADRQMIIQYIQQLVDQGMPLPVDTREALQKEIKNEGVLRIFATASRNKQIINQHLLNAFIKLFDTENCVNRETNNLLLEIFENAAKNNQTLPQELLIKLEEALYKHDLETVLPVFIFLAQKGEVLPQLVIKKLLNKLASEEEPVYKQELLSSLGSLIEANPEEIIQLHLSQVNSILRRELRSDNQNTQKLCIHAASKLFRISRHVEDQLLEELVQIGTNSDTNKGIRHEIKALFDSVIADSFNPSISQRGYRTRLHLANLSFTSPEDLLAQLRCYVKLEGGLVLQNYQQIKDILDNGSMQIQAEALELLHSCNCKSGMTDELFETLAILYDSTVSESLKNSCLQLFNKAVDGGRKLTGRAGTIWQAKNNQAEHVKVFIQSRICKEIREALNVEETLVADLLQLILDAEKLSTVQDLTDLILIIVEEDCDYWHSQSFVLLIEQCMLQTLCLETALPCFSRMIKEKKCCNVQCLEALVQHFEREDNEDYDYLETMFFEAMYYASKSTSLPNACILFALHQLNSSNEAIRGYSFRTHGLPGEPVANQIRPSA